jgi:hypothetical protein
MTFCVRYYRSAGLPQRVQDSDRWEIGRYPRWAVVGGKLPILARPRASPKSFEFAITQGGRR